MLHTLNHHLVASLASFRSHLSQVLHLQESPHRTALAFAIGVFIAFSPTYGLHIASAMFCAWAFRLNCPSLLLGTLINNPWTIAPILAGTIWTGFLILGITDLPELSWDTLSLESLDTTILPYILPFTVGACTLSLLGSLLAYPLSLVVITQHRKRHGTTHEPPSCSQKLV